MQGMGSRNKHRVIVFSTKTMVTTELNSTKLNPLSASCMQAEKKQNIWRLKQNFQFATANEQEIYRKGKSNVTKRFLDQKKGSKAPTAR